MLLIIALYIILKRFGVFSLDSTTEGAMGFGTIFFVGLVAATSSCLAVVGGLLLSVSAQWAELHETDDRWTKLQPLLLFNAGRLGGYFLLGGLAGLLGRSLSLTPWGTGFLTALIAVVMIGLGLNILHIVPKNFCRIPLPRKMQARIHALSRSQNPFAALTLGALTFFLPCGFTQSMQLLALGSGSFFLGGMIMLVFALGTLPSLL
jgi:sulfite exporter TauE/SafE